MGSLICSLIFTYIFVLIENTMVAGIRRYNAFVKHTTTPHEVVATRTKVKHLSGVDDGFDTLVIYEYEVKGKKYKYKMTTSNYPDDNDITLYYRNDPAKTDDSLHYGNAEIKEIVLFFIASLLICSLFAMIF